MKKIYVFLDLDLIEVDTGKYILPISHDSVVLAMKKRIEVIYTHDPYFFQFDTLNDGYDVIVLRNNEGIVLSELLDRDKRGKYGVEKEIRWGHNAYKMLMANAFTMCPMSYEIHRDLIDLAVSQGKFDFTEGKEDA
jgi:hypothetical protein